MAYSYDDALRNRLSSIQGLSDSQTTWERYKAAKNSLAAQSQQYNAQMGAIPSQGQTSNPSSMSSGNADFDKFKNAIGQQESGGNYSATNKSGALGKYQILGGNLAGAKSGWDYEALGYDVTPQQYLQSPEIQEKVATYKLKSYYDKYGAAGAAIAWYSGESNAKKYVNSGYVSGAKQGAYPSISSYSQSILKKMGYA